MSFPQLFALAKEYGVDFSYNTRDIFSIMGTFLDELSLESKKVILKKYQDAGRKSTYIFITNQRTPPIENVLQKAEQLPDLEPDSMFWDNFPYYDDVEVDEKTHTLRIRFHYLKGTIIILDNTGRQAENRLHHSGVVVYRPNSRILEIRVRHKSMAQRMAARIPAHLGLEPFYSMSLKEERLIKTFVDWVSSLNSATIELNAKDVEGSIKINARKDMDLRTAERYNRAVKSGKLRIGHVTIERENAHKTNFRIFFRDCHIKYTLFTCEEDIKYVVDAMEKIGEGYKFVKPSRILPEYFAKKD